MTFNDGETIWYSDTACPECGGDVATNGTKRVCTGCDWEETDG